MIFNKVLIYCLNKTALYIAVKNEFYDIVKLLLSNPKIDVNSKMVVNIFFKYNFNNTFK